MDKFNIAWTVSIFLVLGFALYRLMWPSKKPCQKCEKQTRDSNCNGPMCADCHHDELLQEATRLSPGLMCPIHQQWMVKKIILDTPDEHTSHNMVVYTCSDPSCPLIIFNKDRLHQITMQTLDLYPPLL
ncbi:MAG: hypothetical protein WCL18_06220 [bacterium]